MQLNPNIPLACTGDFFKILKDFIPPEEWSSSYPDAIVARVLEKDNNVMVKPKDYSDAWVALSDGLINVSMYLNTVGGNITQSEFINRFLSVFTNIDSLEATDLIDDEVSGVFYIPEKSINKYVFADLAMNNPLFSSLMYIDESDRASKKKPSVYMHFQHPTTGVVGANITQKSVVRGDPNLKGKSIELFPIGSNYIRVKVSKCASSDKVMAFQSLFSRLLVLYEREKDSIVKAYRQFIPDFDKEIVEVRVEKPKAKLKEIAPEIFIAGHTRKCKTPPEIVNDEEAAEALAEGKKVMIFPKPGDDSSQQRNYVCNWPKYIYPGLKENKLSNAEQFPYMPCCYTSDQSEIKGSKYRHYYLGEDLLEGKDVGQKELYTTNKFAPPDKFGTLPLPIAKLFSILEDNDDYTFVRKGTFRNKSSFLNCVLEGLNSDTNILEIIDEKKRDSYIKKLREDMSIDPTMLACTRQEMFDYNKDEVSDALRDPNVYMNPRMFVAMLEAKFHCNIFLFNRDRLMIPRHAQSYYKTQRRNKCIFILEHIGSESDNASYPQCELITRWNQKEKNETFYELPYASPISRGIEKLSKDLRMSYSLDVKNNNATFNRKDLVRLSRGQNTDSYGKCRMLLIEYQGLLSTLLVNPMQPLPVPEIGDWTIYRVTVDEGLAVADALGIVISGQLHSDGVTRELSGSLGGIDVYIPLVESEKIPKVPVYSTRTPDVSEGLSELSMFSAGKKLARYVVEYMFWLYSTYLHETGIQEINNQTILDFFEDMVVMRPDFKYGKVSKYFSLTSGVLEDGKLVVKSEETVKRLIYVLRLGIGRSKANILSYHTRVSIDNFYLDVADFDQYPLQVILQGDKSVDKWIIEKQTQNVISDSVILDIRSPYFFMNNLVSPVVYLAHNVSSIQEAVSVSLTWYNKGYNDLNADPYEEDMPAVTLYAYYTRSNIKKYNLPGADTAHEIMVLGYKKDGEPTYTCLLPL
jgi:hypothetical protein